MAHRVRLPTQELGHTDYLRGSIWRGLVLGAGWRPSFIHLGLFSGMASTNVNPLGVELTLDFTVLHAWARGPEPHIRVALSFAPQTDESQPAIGAATLGVVWY